MNQPHATYQEIDINTSNPMKLVLMLYDGAINFLRKATEYGEKKDIKNKNIYANKARDIILELNNSLNLEAGGEIAHYLRGLYLFMNRHLMQANWNNDIKGITEVIQLLSNLREGWQEVYKQTAATQNPVYDRIETQFYQQRGFRI